MNPEALRRYLLRVPKEDEPTKIHELPYKFFDPFIVQVLHLDLVEPDRLLCSFKVTPNLVNTANVLQGAVIGSLVDLVGSAAIFASGAPTTGDSVEINISYLDSAFLDEEVEIEANNLRIGRTVAVVSVDLRKKATGKMIAQGRHTKYLAVSKM